MHSRQHRLIKVEKLFANFCDINNLKNYVRQKNVNTNRKQYFKLKRKINITKRQKKEKEES